MDPTRRLNFRRCLNALANQLSRQDLEDMKFVCKDDVPVAVMERIRSPLDLFRTLEERGKLSIQDTSYLEGVLQAVERSNLIGDLQSAGFASQNVATRASPQKQATQDHEFNKMLLKVAQNLTAKEVEQLAYTWADTLRVNMDRITSATNLFQLLQQRQLVKQTDVRVLYEELISIGRSDLCKRINNYLEQTDQQPYVMQMDHDGHAHAGAIQVEAGRIMHPQEESQGFHHHPPTYPPSEISRQFQDRLSHGVSESGQPISTPSDANSSMTCISDVSTIPTSHPESEDTLRGSTGTQDSQNESPAIHVCNTSMSFVPQEVYPIGMSGFSVEETGGMEAFQTGPIGLTFPTTASSEEGEDEGTMTRVEFQDMQTQWTRSQEQLAAKEQEKRQLLEQLLHLQEQNEKMAAEKMGESEQHQASTRELQLLLKKKIDELESLQEELHVYRQNMQHVEREVPNINPDELYKLNKNPHGICLIINNYRFFHETDQNKAHPERVGAQIDQYNLTQTFRYLRYKVEVEENLTHDAMTDRLMRMSQADHSNYDSFICCILSHGERNIVHGANSEPVNINDLTGIMKFCPSLRDKPKLFFIQCCRGEEEDAGIERDNPGDKDNLGGDSFRSTIPRDADFFLGFATPLGKAAYRSRKHGSWYISELCKVFTQYGYHSSLSAMMRRVNRQVSNAFTKDGYKQCTEFVDRLRREVHFFHYIRNRGKR